MFDETNVTAIKSSIIAKFPLFTRFLLDLTVCINEDVKTASTDGVYLNLNPVFMDEKDFDDQLFVVLHEVAHVFLGHPLRRPDPCKNEDFQKACDYAVNDLLQDAGLTTPSDALTSFEFKGMAMEAIYLALTEGRERPRKGRAPQWNPNKHGEVNDEVDGDPLSAPPEPTPEGDAKAKKRKAEKLKEHAKKQTASIVQAKMAGTMTVELERCLQDVTRKPVDWRSLLPSTIEDLEGATDFSWQHPDTRFHDSDFILPSMIGERRGEVVLAVDTSGSISKDVVSQMTSEVLDVITEEQPEKTHVIWCDSYVRLVQTFTDMDDVVLNPVGGGGTNFIPPFLEVEAQGIGPTVLVYLTDGECSKFPENPEFPVVWLVWGRIRNFRPPFGVVVRMEKMT